MTYFGRTIECKWCIIILFFAKGVYKYMVYDFLFVGNACTS